MAIEDILLKDIAFTKDFRRSATGDLDTISGLENLRQALMRRLITRPGKLIHRPDYGVGISDFQNAPMTMSVKRQLALRIADQYPRDPRIASVTGVAIDVPDDDPSMMKLSVSVVINGYGEAKMEFTPFTEVVV